MKKTTLGGDRLGSGGKMQIDLHGYDRSTHDLGYTWRNTMAPGTLVPFMSNVGLPGDTWEIDLNTYLMTLPTVAPLFGSFKIQLDVFECPIRLYNSWLHNNKLKIGNDMSQVKLPIMQLAADYVEGLGQKDNDFVNNNQINPSCILKYLGYSGVGFNNVSDSTKIRDFNAVPLIAYWDIYKNYYANKQEEIGAVIHSGVDDPQEITDFKIKVESDPNEPGNFWVNQTISVNVGDKTGSSTFAEYYAIFGWIIENGSDTVPPDLNQITIWTYGSNTPITLLQYMCDVLHYDEETVKNLWWYDDTNNYWVVNMTVTVADIYANGQTLIWSYQVNSGGVQLAANPARVVTFPLENLDEMREEIMTNVTNTATNISTMNLIPYSYVANTSSIDFRKQTQEGLAIKTYQSDLFNNWVKTEWVEEINNKTAISTTGGKFTIEQLNISKKLYDYYNRIAVSGGSYDDWIEATYDIEKLKQTEIPIYKGGLIKELAFEEVVSNSAAQIGNNNQVLGTLAGKGTMTGNHKGGKVIIKIDEPCYIMGIISITPRIDYSQGNTFDVNLKTLEDLHKPALDQIGFQDLITEQMAWWDTHYDDVNDTWVQKSVGKQPAWMNYMTAVNKTYGKFAIENSEMFMTLNRRYQHDQDMKIKDLTTYIDPTIYNNIFADASIDSMNFWVQVKVDCEVRRKMSAKIIPNV